MTFTQEQKTLLQLAIRNMLIDITVESRREDKITDDSFTGLNQVCSSWNDANDKLWVIYNMLGE